MYIWYVEFNYPLFLFASVNQLRFVLFYMTFKLPNVIFGFLTLATISGTYIFLVCICM